MTMQPIYQLGSCTARIMLGATGEPDTLVWIETMTDMRNQGEATRMLEHLQADAPGDLELFLNPDKNIDKNRLTELFKRAGFVAIPERRDWMLWTNTN